MSEEDVKAGLVARYWAWYRASEQERVILKEITLGKLIDSCKALLKIYEKEDKDGHS